MLGDALCSAATLSCFACGALRRSPLAPRATALALAKYSLPRLTSLTHLPLSTCSSTMCGSVFIEMPYRSQRCDADSTLRRPVAALCMFRSPRISSPSPSSDSSRSVTAYSPLSAARLSWCMPTSACSVESITLAKGSTCRAATASNKDGPLPLSISTSNEPSSYTVVTEWHSSGPPSPLTSFSRAADGQTPASSALSL